MARISPFPFTWSRVAALLLALAAAPRVSAATSPCAASFAQLDERFHLDDQLAFPGDQPFSIRAQSAKNLEAYRASLGPLSGDEEKLARAVEKLPLTVSTRRSSESLAGMSESGGVLSRAELAKRGTQVGHGFTVKTEEDLYGASRFTFATVSATGWKGMPMYGDSVLGVEKDFWAANSWATPTSGLKVWEKYSGMPRSGASMRGIPSFDRAGAQEMFRSQVVAPKDYSARISLDVVAYLRTQPESVRREFYHADPAKLVELMNRHHLGFLEAKLSSIPVSALKGLDGTRVPWSVSAAAVPKTAAAAVAPGRDYSEAELFQYFHGQADLPNVSQGALSAYGAGSLQEVNRDLVLGKPIPGFLQGEVEELDQTIAAGRVVPKDMHLYRGEAINRFTPELTPGKVIEYKNFYSTSADKAAALKFARGDGVIYEIHLPQNSDVHGLFMPELHQGYPAEREILLGRNVKVKILSVTPVDPAAEGAEKAKSLKKVILEIVP